MLRHAWANYRDESFILQYMSPAIIRQFKLFQINDDSSRRRCGSRRSGTSSGYAARLRSRAVEAI